MNAFKANKVNHKEKLSKIKVKKNISITRLVQNNLENGDWVNFQYFKKLLKLRYTLYNLWKSVFLTGPLTNCKTTNPAFFPKNCCFLSGQSGFYHNIDWQLKAQESTTESSFLC